MHKILGLILQHHKNNTKRQCRTYKWKVKKYKFICILRAELKRPFLDAQILPHPPSPPLVTVSVA